VAAAAFGVLLGLSACKDASSDPRMSAAQIKGALVGYTQHGRSVDGDYVAYLAPDGTARFRGGATTVRGTYKITDDGRLCTTWEPKGPMEGCMTVVQTGDTFTFFLPNGVAYQTATLSAGNSDKL
jgi:hypothetical protein